MSNEKESNSVCETIYEPYASSASVWATVVRAINEVLRTRFLIWSLFARDFKAQFRQQVLGYIWVVLTPIIGVAGFIFMNYAGVLKPGDAGMPYPLYAFFGTSAWAALISSMQSVGNGLQQQADLILRTNIPKLSLAISSLASVVYGIFINYLLLVVVSLFFGVVPTVWAITYPFLIVPLLLFGVGIGLILSVIGVIAKDVTNMAVTVMGLVMYATPVIYVSSSVENQFLRSMIEINPLSSLIHFPRSLFYLADVSHWQGFAVSSLFAFGVFLFGVHVFYLLQDKVAERL